MPEEKNADHPHWSLLVTAYRLFRVGDIRGAHEAIDLLKPVIEHDEAANRPSRIAGVLWGLAGDCYFRIGEVDDGFRAYRRAIRLDGEAGCLAFLACQIAWHRRSEDADEGLRCLRAAQATDWRALRRHPVHFLWHSLGREALYFRFVRLPLVRWRLRRLKAEATINY